LVLAGSSVGLGGVAHDHAGSGALIGPGSMAAFAFVVALSFMATARRVTWPLVAAILGIGQLLTHVALSAGHLGAGHVHHGGQPLALPEATAGTDTRMLVLHAGAWVILTILFTVGEKALWRSVERLVPTWTVPALPAPAPRFVAGAAPLPAWMPPLRRPPGRAPPLG